MTSHPFISDDTSGGGPLFVPPDPDGDRAHFRQKSKGLTDKVMTVREAVEQFVHDDDYFAPGGFGGDRISTAVIHEIVRQRKQNLSFAGHTATHDFQILCSGNELGDGRLLARVDAAYIVGLEARGLSPHARRVAESGDLELCEWSNYALALRFHAAAMGVPYVPTRSMAGTDTYHRSAAKQVICPFTGVKLSAIPALSPDIACIHVHEADCFGNSRIRGTSVADTDLARAAKRLIITCERLIPNDEIRRDPTLTVIPYYCVDAVCEVPYGSYPVNMPYEYYSDEVHLRAWLDAEREPDPHRRFLDRHVFGVTEFAEYLELCGGMRRLQELRRDELFPGGN
ncbi:MAG: CoA transferase subunit A [Planctomycetota bacterium]|nr:CoA transferase subunit A [Planctomycetota bacterium]